MNPSQMMNSARMTITRKTHTWMRATCCILALGLLGLFSAIVLSQDQARDNQAFEVLTKAPVHEAFAAPETVNPEPAPIVPKQPPEPIEEVPPDEKPAGDNVVWIGGYWAWDDERADFIWLSGFWRQLPPNRDWVGGHWSQVQGGWQWTPGFWAAHAQTEVEYLPPPPASVDAGPSTPPTVENAVYVPGCWLYQQARYRWRPGFWLTPRPNWVYVPAHFVWTPAGCLFIEGYWDYPLERRGLLFAPVFVADFARQRPLLYRPQFVIGADFLLDSLFVRAEFGRFYYGDYYATAFTQHGFVPWFNYHPVRNAPAPLFAYYRATNRQENWERNLQQLYNARRSGEAPRPPATFAQQQQIIQNIRVNNTIQVGDKTFQVKDSAAAIRNLTAAAPLTKLDQPGIKMVKIPQAKHEEEIKAAKQYHALAKVRQDGEARLIRDGGAKKEAAKLKVETPHRETPRVKVQTPPPVSIPEHVEKEAPKHEPVKPRVLPPQPLPIEKGKQAGELKDGKPPAKEVKPPVQVEKPPVEKPHVEKPHVEKKPEAKPPSSTKKDEKPPPPKAPKDKDKKKDKDDKPAALGIEPLGVTWAGVELRRPVAALRPPRSASALRDHARTDRAG